MAKVILEFNTPEETSELNDALNGWKYKVVLFDLDQALRAKHKYEDVETIEVTEVRKMIHDLLQERDIDIYD